MALVIKNPLANAGGVRDAVQSRDQEDPLEEEMATHSSILAWRSPWTEEAGRPQFIGMHRVGHNRSDLAQHTCIKSPCTWNSGKIFLIITWKTYNKGIIVFFYKECLE